MHRAPALALVVVFKHRKINHPQRLPALGEQARLFAEDAVTDFQAQCADAVVDHLGLVGTKKQDVAVLRASAFEDFSHRRIVNVLDNRALQAFTALGHIVDLDPGQAFGTVYLDEFGVGVDFAAADFSAAGHAQGHHASPRCGGRCAEDLEVHVTHDIGEFGEFEVDAQIGLVRAVAVHRVGVSHHRELAQIGTEHGFENVADHALEHVANFLLAHEGGFDINLGKFRLTVGAQVFIAKALRNLVVAVKTGHHQQLLEQLRALRQRKKVAFIDAARHQIITRAFWRAFGQHRGFDVDEPVGIEKLARFHCHAVTQHQVVLHVGAAQVQHPVREACGFRQVVVVQLKRRCHAGVEHDQLMAQHLDLAAFQAGVDGAFRTRADNALDLNAELVAHVFGNAEHLGPVRVANYLHIALAVAQVNENHAAMVSAAVDPAAQADGLIHQAFGDQTAIGRTHLSALFLSNSHKKYSNFQCRQGQFSPFTREGSAVTPQASRARQRPWKSHTSAPHRRSSSTRCIRFS